MIVIYVDLYFGDKICEDARRIIDEDGKEKIRVYEHRGIRGQYADIIDYSPDEVGILEE